MRKSVLGITLAALFAMCIGCASGESEYAPRDLRNISGVPPSGFEMARGDFLLKAGLRHYLDAQLAHHEEDERREFDQAIRCLMGAVQAYNLAIERYPEYAHDRINDKIEHTYGFLHRMLVERPLERERIRPLLEQRGADGLTNAERARMYTLEEYLLPQKRNK